MKPDDVKAIPIIVYERGNVFSKRNVMIMVCSIITLILFASFSSLKSVFGDIGIVALGFVTLMFGTGILSEVRIRLWNVFSG